MVSIKVGYTLLLLSIVLLCVWFYYVGGKNESPYKRWFVRILWMTVALYELRLFDICMTEGSAVYGDQIKSVERCLYYIFVNGIHLFYMFFLLTLSNRNMIFSLCGKALLLVTTIGVDILIVTSPWTKLVFYVEDGIVYKGKVFWGTVAIRAIYEMIGISHTYNKRKMLPRIFGQSIFLISIFSAIEITHLVITRDEQMLYTTLVSNVLVLMMGYIVIEFHKDKTTDLFNQEAFEQYVKWEIHKDINESVYLIKIKKYEALQENDKENSAKTIIKEMACCLRNCTGISSIYYLGNGRFALITTSKDSFSETEFIKRMKERLREPFNTCADTIYLKLLIIGMDLKNCNLFKSNFRKYFESFDMMSSHSDEMLEFVDGQKMGAEQLQRYYDVEEAIERAITENKFEMYYQPIICAKSKKMISAEALIRLEDRVLGWVSPEEFIPIAERNGTIFEIGEFVIDSVFRFIKECEIEKLGMEYIELNLSMKQFLDEKFPERLKYYLEKYRLDAKRVNLEITETADNLNDEGIKERIKNVREMGFSLSLDDYGTGYSNLVRVLEYPIDIVKLDKSIVWGAFRDEDSYVVLKNLISMFHDVRRRLVAEGIENEEQEFTLHKLGCDYLQGYYYSKPVNEQKIVQLAGRFNFE